MKRSLPLVVILLMLGTLKGQSISIAAIGLQEARSKSERLQLAKDLLETFEPIDAAVPTLSPSQKEWLAEERKAGVDVIKLSQRARILSFYQSQEYTIEYTKTRLLSLVAFLRILVGPAVANGVTPARTQVFEWSEVAYILLEQSVYDYLTSLQKQGYFDDLSPSAMSFFDDQFHMGGIYGKTILGSIVMPYLAQEQFPE